MDSTSGPFPGATFSTRGSAADDPEGREPASETAIDECGRVELRYGSLDVSKVTVAQAGTQSVMGFLSEGISSRGKVRLSTKIVFDV